MLTPEQQAMRRTGIGASEIAKVVGRSKWGGPLDVYLEKVGEAPPWEETKPQQRGRILEPAVLRWWEEETGMVALPSPGTLRHPSIPIALATPDALGTRRGDTGRSADRLVQAKTAHLRTIADWGEPGTDEIPTEYLLQVQWEMGVAGFQRADLAVLIAGDDFRIYPVAFDAELFGALADAALRFWRDHVERRQPPPMDGSAKADAWLRERFPRDERADMLPATESVEAVLADLLKIRALVKRLQEDDAKLSQHVKAYIGDAVGVMGERFKATWKRNKDGSATDWEAVARSLAASAAHLQLALNAPGGRVSGTDEKEQAAALLKAAVQRFTTTTPGARVFRPAQLKEK